MPRQLISNDHLLDILNRELSNHDTCTDCRFTSITLLRGVDESGCNWSTANLRCSGQPAEVCLPAAGRVINTAKDRYNIREQGR